MWLDVLNAALGVGAPEARFSQRLGAQDARRDLARR